MHSCFVILRFRSHCIYVLMINGSSWSESLMRCWLHLHLNLVYSATERVCLENEISVIVIISFTCSRWEDSPSWILSSTLQKVTQYKVSVEWGEAEGELLILFAMEPFVLQAHRKWPLLGGTSNFSDKSEVVGKSPQGEMGFCILLIY